MTPELVRAALAALALVTGALLCLLAGAGVLRLPDVFARLHAATKAGVVGTGLVLVGVAASDGTLATWLKVSAAILFLLATTPVAGHLLGRAAYRSGAPLWSGTGTDRLAEVLPRGRFEPGSFDPTSPSLPRPGEARVERIILALAQGPQLDAAIQRAIALARAHGAELSAVALIDTPLLENVGPVPLGASWYATQMRMRRLGNARQAAADAIQRFETAAGAERIGSVRIGSVRLEEGSPAALLRELAAEGCLVVMADGGWFDQGVLGFGEVERRLARIGARTVHVLR